MDPKPDLLPKRKHGATRHIDVGMPIHPSQLSLDSVRRHAVVGVHSHHVRGGRRSNGGVEPCHDASVGVKPDDAERPRQPTVHPVLERGLVAVVHQHHFEFLGSLRIQVVQHLVEVLVGLVTRNDDGGAHGSLKVTNLQPDDV